MYRYLPDPTAKPVTEPLPGGGEGVRLTPMFEAVMAAAAGTKMAAVAAEEEEVKPDQKNAGHSEISE